MHQNRDGSFGEMFPLDTRSLKEQEELTKKMMEALSNPNIKATHYGTTEELNKVKEQASWNTETKVQMTEFNKQYKLPLYVNHGMFFDAHNHHVLDIENDAISKLVYALINTGIEIDNDDFSHINFPVYYKPTKIFDVNDKEIVSIRGWGRIQKMENGADIQDRIGNEIAELINKSCPK